MAYGWEVEPSTIPQKRRARKEQRDRSMAQIQNLRTGREKRENITSAVMYAGLVIGWLAAFFHSFEIGLLIVVLSICIRIGYIVASAHTSVEIGLLALDIAENDRLEIRDDIIEYLHQRSEKAQ